MQTSVERTYLDSSAAVKLVVRERETDALLRFLAERPHRVSCALIRVEVLRAVRPYGQEAIREGHEILRYVHQVEIDDTVLDLAASIGPPVLRSLDAIHLAAAWQLGPNIEVITYDHRLRDAARVLGLAVTSPGI